MPAIHYSFIATISASRLSSRMKLVLIILCSYAQEKNWLQVSVKSLTDLTSTSERHLRRILHELASLKLLNIEYRNGLSSVYHFPDNYRTVNGELTADWSDCHVRLSTEAIEQSNRDDGSKHDGTSRPCPVSSGQHPALPNIDPAMISSWHECFGIRYSPISVEEQRAMDWMIYAQHNDKLCRIKSPIGFLKKIVINGHPEDFPSFVERRSKAKARIELDGKQEQEAVQLVEQSWEKYADLPKARQIQLARRFQQEVIEKNRVRKVQDLFQKEGLNNVVIRSLFKTYVHERLKA